MDVWEDDHGTTRSHMWWVIPKNGPCNPLCTSTFFCPWMYVVIVKGVPTRMDSHTSRTVHLLSRAGLQTLLVSCNKVQGSFCIKAQSDWLPTEFTDRFLYPDGADVQNTCRLETNAFDFMSKEGHLLELSFLLNLQQLELYPFFCQEVLLAAINTCVDVVPHFTNTSCLNDFYLVDTSSSFNLTNTSFSPFLISFIYLLFSIFSHPL